MNDAITSRIAAIIGLHQPTTKRLRSEKRPGFYVNRTACKECGWVGKDLSLDEHHAHVAQVIVDQLGLIPAPGLVPTPYWANWSAEDSQKCHDHNCGHMRGDHRRHTDGAPAPCLQHLCLCDEFLAKKEDER